MSGGTVVVVAVSGAVGAVLRHELTSRGHDPLRSLHVVNVVGSLLLGVTAGGGFGLSTAVFAAGAGALGAFTSFSTWMVGARGRDPLRHVLLPAAVSLLAAAVGLLLVAPLLDRTLP